MSLLGQPFAMPSRVKGAVQLLVQERGQRMKRESVEALLSPASLKGEETGAPKLDMVRRTLDECVRLGLFLEDGDTLLLNPALPKATRTPATVAASLPGTILDLILDPANAVNEDIATMMAWFLNQDVLDPPKSGTEMGARMVADDVFEIHKFNNTRFANFWYWARYLGLANVLAVPKSGGVEERLAPDPTECLRRVLHEVLNAAPRETRGRASAIGPCLQAVSARCPLFEGGAVRAVMDEFSKPREAKHLSASTSLALLRLEHDGTIALELRSDAQAVVLVDGAARRSVSDVTWLVAARRVA